MWRAWSCCSWGTKEQEGYVTAVKLGCRDRCDLQFFRGITFIFSYITYLQDDADGTKVSGLDGAQDGACSHRPITVPEQSPNARPLASGSLEEEEAAVSNKDLGEWLRQHPTYMDMPGFTPVKPPSVTFTVVLFCKAPLYL